LTLSAAGSAATPPAAIPPCARYRHGTTSRTARSRSPARGYRIDADAKTFYANHSRKHDGDLAKGKAGRTRVVGGRVVLVALRIGKSAPLAPRRSRSARLPDASALPTGGSVLHSPLCNRGSEVIQPLRERIRVASRRPSTELALCRCPPARARMKTPLTRHRREPSEFAPYIRAGNLAV
jgi:hypothetical protein